MKRIKLSPASAGRPHVAKAIAKPKLPAALDLNLPGRFLRNAWQPPDDLQFDDWMKIGTSLQRVEGSVQWWLGDWWAFGEHTYGTRAEAARSGRIRNLAFGTLANYAVVSRAFAQTSRRREVLPFSHHAEVAKLSQGDQEMWLMRAESWKWSRETLRKKIAQSQKIAQSGADDRIHDAEPEEPDGVKGHRVKSALRNADLPRPEPEEPEEYVEQPLEERQTKMARKTTRLPPIEKYVDEIAPKLGAVFPSPRWKERLEAVIANACWLPKGRGGSLVRSLRALAERANKYADRLEAAMEASPN